MFNSAPRLLSGVLVTCLLASSALAQPANDDCEDALLVGEGVFPFSNVDATTDGPSPCGDLGSDVWFLCDSGPVGSVSFTTCTPARTFDTVLAVYGGTDCVGPLRACNDDDLTDPNCGLEGSTIRLRASWFSRYLIQVGGDSGEQGDAELAISFCGGDFDADGEIGLSDLATMLAEFGGGCGAGGCVTDIDGDDDVDLSDLAYLVARYGMTCP